MAVYAESGSEIALVLKDLMMPIMDGVSTIQALSRIDPCVRVIAASGLADGEMTARASCLGVQHFLCKPYTAKSLLEAVARLLEELREGPF